MTTVIRPCLSLLHSDGEDAHIVITSAKSHHGNGAQTRSLIWISLKVRLKKKGSHTEIKARVDCKEPVCVREALDSLRTGAAQRDNGLLKKAICHLYASTEGESRSCLVYSETRHRQEHGVEI